jgi:REP element-mobilizing transposase RayT
LSTATLPDVGKKDIAVGSTYYSLHYHIVFSTKERRPWIQAQWRDRLHEYLGGTLRGLGGIAEAVGGVEEHVHLLTSLKTTAAPAEMVRELKKSSSAWAAEKHEPRFSWQEGYSIFSVSWTHVPAVRRYIATQAEHHHKTSFEEELKRILEKNGVAYDPRYLQ